MTKATDGCVTLIKNTSKRWIKKVIKNMRLNAYVQERLKTQQIAAVITVSVE